MKLSLVTFIVTTGAAIAWSDVSAAGTPAASCSVTVSTGNALGRVAPIAVGLNTAAWDGDLVDADVLPLLTDANVRVLRYPGGSTSDNYHWMTNLPDDPTQGGTVPAANFDAYMSVVDAVGAQAMITVNYGSGTPDEAAGWVEYANQGGCGYAGPVPTFPGASASGQNYGIRYWEIGNEVYGEGTYGATWEVDHHSHDPTTYAEGVVSYSAAMKAVDPSIQIGVVVTAPGNWPDGVTSASSPLPWNDTVLPIACDAIDFVDVHWYPQGPTGESDAALLASPESGESTPVSFTPSIPSMAASLKSQIARYCGAHASAVKIMITETNSVSFNPGKQTTSLVNALYLDDEVMTWLENGITNVDWWVLHNSPFVGNADPSLFGSYSFGDYGVLSSGVAASNGAIEPPADTPFPAYYGLKMLSNFARGRDTMLGVTSSTPLVAAHAVQGPEGAYHVMLVNKDPAAAYSVTVSLDRARSHGNAEVHTYGQTSVAIDKSTLAVRGSSFAITVQPYSVTTIKLP